MNGQNEDLKFGFFAERREILLKNVYIIQIKSIYYYLSDKTKTFPSMNNMQAILGII